ncbi:hypothetical protein CLV24_13438 [Pontibacter ummariensis]|uniref:SH3 domain-containing protein n=1 Tax=Pontibacter ummariensis TaxID=1610492 RepID=A0A239L245_9BACT|nr:hypothetical protein [Pontibacter ummariensis]PRY04632.1 hypothetical protein CLV24_13438 [Pontibacter ummariensis]SNT23809.1 hypothetical protein SAMN06296052_1345 [Pontibacter ummariensis]
MKQLLTPLLFVVPLTITSCGANNDAVDEAEMASTPVAEEESVRLPADVLYATKPLINGKLYNHPDFDSKVVAYFDTAQQIQVLDASDNVFVRARLQQDTSLQIGYLPKAILPERNKK